MLQVVVLRSPAAVTCLAQCDHAATHTHAPKNGSLKRFPFSVFPAIKSDAIQLRVWARPDALCLLSRLRNGCEVSLPRGRSTPSEGGTAASAVKIAHCANCYQKDLRLHSMQTVPTVIRIGRGCTAEASAMH